MTSFENGYMGWIDLECGTYETVCEDAIADVISIILCCQILVVAWTILYDLPKPLK
jgi:hypothetical protein